MKITLADVRKVADLARLSPTDAECRALQDELAAVLDYMEVLAEVDTADVPPTSHPLPLTAPLRDDDRRATIPREAALANAPQTDGESFVVPRVV